MKRFLHWRNSNCYWFRAYLFMLELLSCLPPSMLVSRSTLSITVRLHYCTGVTQLSLVFQVWRPVGTGWRLRRDEVDPGPKAGAKPSGLTGGNKVSEFREDGQKDECGGQR